MTTFDKEKDEMLIKLVRDRPIIYDSNHPQHRNLITKHTEWKEISSALNVPIVDCQKRWKHFRDHYKKKMKLKSKKNTWKYTSLLHFLSAPSKLSESDKRKRVEGESRSQSREPDTPELSDISVFSEYDDLATSPVRSGTPLPEIGLKFTSNIPEPNNPITRRYQDTQIQAGPSTSFQNTIQKKRKPGTERPATFLEDVRKRLSTTDIRGSIVSDETPIDVENSPNSEDSNSMKSLDGHFNSDMSKGARHDSPIHRYFAVIADIATMFPPHLAADLKLRIHKSVYQIEMEWLRRKKEGHGSE